MPPEKLVIFDLAALVLNHSRALCQGIAVAFHSHGMVIDEEVSRMALGHSLEGGVMAVWRETFSDRTLNAEMQRSLAESYRKEVLRFLKYSPSVRPMPAVLNTIAQLRVESSQVGVSSDLDLDMVNIIFDRLERSASEMLDGVVVAGEIGAAGFKAERLAQLMVQCGVKDGRSVIHVGTTEADIAAGRQVNCAQVFLLKTEGESTLRAEGADGVLAFADELMDHLNTGRSVQPGDA